jgi:hypothetical protein
MTDKRQEVIRDPAEGLLLVERAKKWLIDGNEQHLKPLIAQPQAVALDGLHAG